VNASLGAAGHIKIAQQKLALRFDPARLPHTCRQAKKSVRVFTEEIEPRDFAQQRRTWGLLMPRDVDPARRMVILIHGLDCNRGSWQPMAKLLQHAGYQVGYFSYPSDGPVRGSVSLLSDQMHALHEAFPRMRLSIITHSMGGLVARGYVEGPNYAGNVDDLIMLAPPNQGSTWARYRFVLELREHYHLWRHNPNWRLSWMITDGLGEAGSDLEPGSRFLDKLNSRPRRAGVHYTIVAGDRGLLCRVEGEALLDAASLVPARARSWWGLHQVHAELEHAAWSALHHTGRCDGPVTLGSAHLAGVSDIVVLPADHNSLYLPIDGEPPAAWPVIRDRLAALR
jgi:pimeloyl-ACP methyl ester carboxylesterase